MKFFITGLMLLSFQTMAQSNLEIKEFKEVVKKTKASVKNFNLENSDLALSSVDYMLARKLLKHVINEKPLIIEQYLQRLETKVLKNYKIMKSLENIKNNRGVEKTLELATNNFKKSVSDSSWDYHDSIGDFVLKDIVKVYRTCVSVLCQNQIDIDINNWFKEASKLNKKLKLYGASVPKMPKKELKHSIKTYRNFNRSIYKTSVVLEASSRESINLEDSRINTSDLLFGGARLISEYGLDTARKITQYEIPIFYSFSHTVWNSTLKEIKNFMRQTECNLDVYIFEGEYPSIRLTRGDTTVDDPERYEQDRLIFHTLNNCFRGVY